MKAYGAKVVLSDGTKGMKGAIEKANELKEENPNALYETSEGIIQVIH